MDHVRQHVEQDHHGRCVDDIGVKEQKGQGRGEEHQPRQPHQKVHHGVGVADALEDRQALAQQRVVGAENLHHAPRPADALADMRRQALGRQPCCLRNAQVGRGPAVAVQAQGGVGIFGHGFHRKTANRVNRGTPQNGARAAEERCVPHVVAVLDQAVEQLAFIGTVTESAQVTLERVRRKEVVRGLHQRQFRVAQKPAHGQLQEGAGGHVVAVKNRHQIAVEQFQRMVEVTCLGVTVVGAGDVVDAHLFGERLEAWTVAVIEQMDAQLVFRPVDAQRRIHRATGYGQLFVVGGNQQVDHRPLAGVCRQLGRFAIERP